MTPFSPPCAGTETRLRGSRPSGISHAHASSHQDTNTTYQCSHFHGPHMASLHLDHFGQRTRKHYGTHLSQTSINVAQTNLQCSMPADLGGASITSPGA